MALYIKLCMYNCLNLKALSSLGGGACKQIYQSSAIVCFFLNKNSALDVLTLKDKYNFYYTQIFV